MRHSGSIKWALRFATVIARFIFLLLAATFATATIGSNSANEKVFTTPDGTFRFVYPAEFVLLFATVKLSFVSPTHRVRSKGQISSLPGLRSGRL
jgi:hypothetical protein